MVRRNSRVYTELTKTEVRGLLAMHEKTPLPGKAVEKLREALRYTEQKDEERRNKSRSS
jgi:hypothetical protein